MTQLQQRSLFRSRACLLGLLFVLALIVGCGSEELLFLNMITSRHRIGLKICLFAARRIEDAVGAPQENQLPFTYPQLVEMIGWIPEVAAETDLSESDWNQIMLAVKDW